jgi:hypothetical protein
MIAASSAAVARSVLGSLDTTALLSAPTLSSVVLVVVLVKLLWSNKSTSSSCSSKKAGSESESPDETGVFSLVPARGAQCLHVNDEDLEEFDETVRRINEVRLGIFFGEAGGQEVKGFQPGAFTKALQELRLRVGDAWSAGGQWHEPLDDAALALRLIATDLDVARAAHLVEEYEAFRCSLRGGGVKPSLEWVESGVSLVPCVDRLGRPVLVIRFRHHKPGKIDQFRQGMRSLLDAVKFHNVHNRRHTFHKNNPLEQYALVLDFEGASWSNLDWQALQVTLEEGSLRYPNMGSQIYMLNVSCAVRWIYGRAQSMLHPKIQRKCMLVAPEDVHSCMQKLLPVDQIPREYGGLGAPWCEPESTRTFEDQVGELAASIYLQADVVPDGALPPLQGLHENPPLSQQEDSHKFQSAPSWGCFDTLIPGCMQPSVRKLNE